jgi:thymidylate synthase (FAD)
MIVNIRTKAVLLDKMGNDLSVVNAARVSFGKRQDEFVEGKDDKLINYLAEHEHISPFGHSFASFHVTAPVFVARQLVKHKFLRWNEISRRYVSTTPDMWMPFRWRQANPDKKQGSKDEEVASREQADIVAATAMERALQAYEELLLMGVCEEQARAVLPQSTMTEWIWSGSLDAFASMYNLRSPVDAQAETREVAVCIGTAMEQAFPVAWKALTNRN